MKKSFASTPDSHGPPNGGTASTEAAVAADPEPSIPPPSSQQSGSLLDAPENDPAKKPITERFWLAFKAVLFSSKLNLLLVFVPAGIAVGQFHHLSPGLIFGLNAVAIVPLAGLLSFATESVAHRLGDSLGALLNVTFGNAVELIIFISLIKNEVRIVQAALLGSILSNLLLVLGMSFFVGGLRYREQIYNSTVTQMSACLLSLSVVSLLLPTAFHASFNDEKLADEQSLKISRGTSVVLLLVYILYLLFQLISHSYLYESTPQHIIDEESRPGPAANWLDSSSDSDGSGSSSSSSSSSDSDSDHSDHSETVSRRVRKAIRRHRRSSGSSSSSSNRSKEPSQGSPDDANANADDVEMRPVRRQTRVSELADDEADDDDRRERGRGRKSKKHRHRKHKERKNKEDKEDGDSTEHQHQERSHDTQPTITVDEAPSGRSGRQPRRVDFNPNVTEVPAPSETPARSRSPLQRVRGLSLLPVVSSLTPSVFTQPPDADVPPAPSGPVPRVRYGIRRTNSLPDRLNQPQHHPHHHHGHGTALSPSQILLPRPLNAAAAAAAAAAAGEDEDEPAYQLSCTGAVILLLVSTGLVAICAELMVESISGLVETSNISEAFIGLVILPVVGNAAEHVTALTVALKNKMDLAIGVAVGSSIQVALFVTPLVVIIGWAANRDMSLYFTLFETVCLFVSTFITNFLVLDGRSNYLEGALLMATYVIIGIMAFFYPSVRDASMLGG
ncbi:hypothetical protein VTJ83DRAFT_191 [Remersonia thermophila]|uniref:Sodium/calcium exchanger membrane region domain-containing protein n=1 Tax=Remersonia thermophila TaxID=72144 RepID=A0ABR4DKD8_9PEZI